VISRLVVAFLHGFAIVLAIVPAGASFAMNVDLHNTTFITSDGVRLHVLEGGPGSTGNSGAVSKPVIAFVPGWSLPASIWHDQLTVLGAKYRVAALDPRGQGESQVPSSGFDVERRSTDLNEFIARYGHVVLVAWSLGALEALEYVYRYGEAALDALVIVDSSVGENPPPPPGGDFIEALKRDRRATLEEFVQSLFHSPRPQSELDELTASAMRMPLDSSLSLFPRTVPRTHWRDIARGFDRPLLYVVTPHFAEQAENLRQHRPSTRTAVFESAGHALFVDEPARFNELLTDFIGEVAKASHSGSQTSKTRH